MLKSGSQPIFPTVSFDEPDTICVCIYGFSDKPIYDDFISCAGQLLTPYPLVKGYLVNQIADADSTDSIGVGPALVILDATNPAQPVLAAATMAAVLRAQQEKAKQVPVEFEFVFDSETASYQIKSDGMS